MCRDLARSGAATLFISHRFEELLALADSIVVMRDGQTVPNADAAVDSGQVTRQGLLVAMARGTDADAEVLGRSAAMAGRRVARERGPAVLRTQAVDLGGGPIDWELGVGAIVGLAGLEGHGQEQFLRTLAGLAHPGAGRVLRVADTVTTPIRSQGDAGRHRIAYLPRSRSRDGIFPSLSVVDNYALPTLGRSTSFGSIRRRLLYERFAAAEKMLHIRAASPHALVTTLSGGNQQKVLLARWLAAEPTVDDPDARRRSPHQG